MGLRVKFLFLLAGFAFFYSACDKPVDPPSDTAQPNPYDTVTVFKGLCIPQTGKLRIKLNYSFGNKGLVMDTEEYNNPGGDTFTISFIRHYFSNLTLIGDKGKVNLGNYQLVNAEEPNSLEFEMNNVPAGIYSDLSAILGVDSLRNSSDLQEGALDPAYGMFWTWATGYIFFKYEGITSSGKTFSVHVGGNTVIPENQTSLIGFKIKSSTPTLLLNIDLSEMWVNPNTYSFKKDGYDVHSPAMPANAILLQNMKDMISVKQILP